MLRFFLLFEKVEIHIIADKANYLAIPEVVAYFAATQAKGIHVIGIAAFYSRFQEKITERIEAQPCFAAEYITCYRKPVVQLLIHEDDKRFWDDYAPARFPDSRAPYLSFLFVAPQFRLSHIVEVIEVSPIGMFNMNYVRSQVGVCIYLVAVNMALHAQRLVIHLYIFCVVVVDLYSVCALFIKINAYAVAVLRDSNIQRMLFVVAEIRFVTGYYVINSEIVLVPVREANITFRVPVAVVPPLEIHA